jgi:hypothetical protein
MPPPEPAAILLPETFRRPRLPSAGSRRFEHGRRQRRPHGRQVTKGSFRLSRLKEKDDHAGRQSPASLVAPAHALHWGQL